MPLFALLTQNASFVWLRFATNQDCRRRAARPPLEPRLTVSHTTAMYASTFIFAKGNFDDEFHRLDQQIAEAARSTPGYLGEETWENPSNGLVSNVYYWESLESLHALVTNKSHLEAKSKQENWLEGYQVVISQVIKVYGDGKLSALLPVPGAA
jgi:heme-degrading monooxygenase HmoA